LDPKEAAALEALTTEEGKVYLLPNPQSLNLQQQIAHQQQQT